jgi:hypothetical protein
VFCELSGVSDWVIFVRLQVGFYISRFSVVGLSHVLASVKFPCQLCPAYGGLACAMKLHSIFQWDLSEDHTVTLGLALLNTRSHSADIAGTEKISPANRES